MSSATSETVLLRQEVSQLKAMVKELVGRVQQYEQQSYSEEDSEAEPLIGTETQNRAQSEPNLQLSEAVPVNPGKVSQSAQTIFPYVPKPSFLT